TPTRLLPRPPATDRTRPPSQPTAAEPEGKQKSQSPPGRSDAVQPETAEASNLSSTSSPASSSDASWSARRINRSSSRSSLYADAIAFDDTSPASSFFANARRIATRTSRPDPSNASVIDFGSTRFIRAFGGTAARCDLLPAIAVTSFRQGVFRLLER